MTDGKNARFPYDPAMKCIVGLGNPGSEYRSTRHNVGFLFADFFRDAEGFSDFEDAPKFHGLVANGTVKGEKVALLRPLTYMNLSGQSVAALVNFYKLDPAKDLLVVSDDIDMEFGKVRFREKGSSGGQNGLKSIAASLGTENFARIKIGIGRDAKFDTADWVLSKFRAEELAELSERVFPEASEKIVAWLTEGKA
jgi:PTH1 family peptidyl-tRNA hydrolase